MIQPAMYSGRYESPRRIDRVTLADVAQLVEQQTDGLFVEADFTPIPCSDPNCFSLAVALRNGAKLLPVSRYLPRYGDWADSQLGPMITASSDTFDRGGELASLLSTALSSGALSAIDDDKLEEILDWVVAAQQSEQNSWSDLFAIGVKPFMDAYTYDQDRIDKCCVHILAHDGTPVSFCEYNAVNRPLGRL